MHLDQHFAGLRLRHRPFAQLQDIGRARLGDFNCTHTCSFLNGGELTSWPTYVAMTSVKFAISPAAAGDLVKIDRGQ
jgi:hypothetical protein